MKQLVFSLAFMLISSFAFASNNEVKENNTTIDNVKVVKYIDLANFKSMVKNGQIKIVKRVDFTFYDSCGGVWNVSGGDGMSLGDIIAILWEWDGGC